MIYIKKRALKDLQNISLELLNWKRIKLSEEFVLRYTKDIVDACFNLENLTVHYDTEFLIHKRFGKKVYAYKRNKRTAWYIIYDFDKFNNIIIKKIISNYKTIS